ncbi:MAG: copper chaperone PCu(A)C [Acidobacteria bacterium]|nr:copper chaperone PCu(A)C [Acidobacteriota bacterium]
MMVTRAIGVAGVALLLAGQAGSAQQAQASATGAWVREPAAGATSTAAFAVIENPSMYEIYVVSVSADAAEAAEVVTGPPEAVKPVPELAVPAYGRAELEPGGAHIRLKDLKQPLKEGDSVQLTLTTDGGVTITVSAPVKKG